MFSIADAESWFLFALGIGFAVIAAIDAFAFDDPYPGYGKRVEIFKEATSTYTEVKD